MDLELAIHNACERKWKFCACMKGFQIFTESQPKNLGVHTASYITNMVVIDKIVI